MLLSFFQKSHFLDGMVKIDGTFFNYLEFKK